MVSYLQLCCYSRARDSVSVCQTVGGIPKIFLKNSVAVNNSLKAGPCFTLDDPPIFVVADGINSVGDYSSSPGGCRLCLCVCVCVPTFFHVSRWDNF